MESTLHFGAGWEAAGPPSALGKHGEVWIGSRTNPFSFFLWLSNIPLYICATFVVRWMELESVIESEVSQKEKNKYRMLTDIYGI